MSKHRVVVLKIVANQLSVTEAATRYGISRRHLHRLLARYRTEGLDGLKPRSRRPLSNAKATPDQVRDPIVQLRAELRAQGADPARDDRLAPGTGADQPAVHLGDPADHHTPHSVLREPGTRPRHSSEPPKAGAAPDCQGASIPGGLKS